MSSLSYGREALTAFHNASLIFSDYKLRSVDELANTVSKGHPNIFIEGLGDAIINEMKYANMTMGRVRIAMENLAHLGRGKIPSSMTPFFQSLANQQISSSWVDAIPYTIKHTSSDVVKGTVEIGNAVIDTGKSLLQFGPILLILGAAAFIFYKVRT